MSGDVSHINPEGLHRNPAYSQAVSVSGQARTVYVGGQNAVDEQGRIVAQGDIEGQTRQALRNVETAVAAAGGRLEDVVKLGVYLLEGQPLQLGFKVFAEVWGERGEPPAVTVAVVSGLAHPDFLVEIEALAVIERGR